MNEFDRRGAGKQFSRIGWGVFTFLAVSLVVQEAFILLLEIVGRSDLTQEGWFLIVFSEVSMYAFGFPACLAIMKNRPAPAIAPGPKLSAGEFISFFCMTITVTYAFNIFGNILMQIVSNLLGTTIDNPLDSLLDGTSLWLQLFTILIIAPFMEEFIFRKCVVTSLAKYSHRAAIVVSGLSFGLVHGNFYQFFYAAAIGMLFAYIYLRTGRLRYTIALHFLVNFFGGAVPLLLQTNIPAIADLESFENFGEMIDFFQNNIWKLIPYLGYLFFMGGIAITGFVLLIVKRKSFRLSLDCPAIPRGRAFQTVFVNSGMIVMILLGLLIFALNIFQPMIVELLQHLKYGQF